MQTFLDKTATYIIENYTDQTDTLCVVLPNRRAGLFLKSSLAHYAGKPIWSPAIFSVEDFIIELSGLRVIEPVYLQAELYEVHREIEGNAAQSFSEFLKWGQVLLNDFNDIDLYRINASQLFSNLTDEKALALWNLDQQPLTEFEIRYLHFYNSLLLYYDKLSDRLLKKHQGYQGLAYKFIADNIETKATEMPWKKIIFVGFNALTACEEYIFSYLEKSGIADFLWDSDSYYQDDKVQEAGNFLREHARRFNRNGFNWIENHLATDKKTIEIIGVAQNIGQVKMTGQLLNRASSEKKDLTKTAVVLNNESLIIPLLNSIPEEITEFNLTMGLPLKDTPLFRLIRSVFELQINSIKFDKSGGKNTRLYFRDILKILEHPYISLVAGYRLSNSVIKSFRDSNKIFIGYEEFKATFFTGEPKADEFFSILFAFWENNPATAIETLMALLKLLKISIERSNDTETELDGPEHKLDMEYLFSFSKVMKKLKSLLTDFPYIENISTLHDIFNQIVQALSIPFYGEPLKGLQIMGMLETRTLDFETLIMLSVNEDFIPQGKNRNSFIPFAIKQAFGLPTYRERNAVYAYHFYRLLQRAQTIYLLYNTQPGDLGGGDKSRFISQIQYELSRYNPNISIQEKIVTVPPKTEKIDNSIAIAKSADIIEILNKIAGSGFSASALNTYRNCSLQFYFQYIAGISEPDDAEETIEASTLGTVIHKVLQQLYIPFKGNRISSEGFNSMKPRVEGLVNEMFKANYQGGETGYGKNLLILKVANLLINNFIESEIKFIQSAEFNHSPLYIKELEGKFETSIVIENNGMPFGVNLKGVFDRVDETGGFTRIIDYKTGRVEQRDLNLKSWEDLITDSNLDKCFQLLFYSLILSKSASLKPEKINPGIISFRNLSSGLLTIKLPDGEGLSDPALENTEQIIGSIILSEIFNTDIPFRQTEDPENCEYCAFKGVCNR